MPEECPLPPPRNHLFRFGKLASDAPRLINELYFHPVLQR